MKDILEALNGIIKIPSVTGEEPDGEYPYGKNVHSALIYTLELCESLGFRTQNMDNQIGFAEIGEGEELIGVLFHLDVVPPGNGWDTNPFELTAKGGKLFGRGVLDDKGPGIASLYAAYDLLQENFPLNKRIRFIFGLQEEQGDWEDINYYLSNEEKPDYGFTPDGDFPLIQCEKGILHLELIYPKKENDQFEIVGGDALNMVPDYCKAVFHKGSSEDKFEFHGKSAHACTPEEGFNAISGLIEKLYKEDISASFIDFYNKYIGFDLTGKNLGIDFSDKLSGDLSFLNSKIRTEDDKIYLSLDIRYPVTYELKFILDTIKDHLPPDCQITVLNHDDPLYLDTSSPVLKALYDAYYSLTDKKDPVVITGGGTYARSMDNIVAFGPCFPGKENTEHQPNEYMIEEDFFLLRKIYNKAFKNLLEL